MELQGISKLDLKKRNRMQILRVIRESGPISRVDIASSMKITRAAVTIITNEMINEGVLYEVGEAPVSLENLQKGRRKILIDINENFKFAFGASISDELICVGPVSYTHLLTKNTEPKKVEMDLVKLIPPEISSHFCHQVVQFGRDICLSLIHIYTLKIIYFTVK